MLDTHALSDDELLETMTSLQGEMDRRYRVEELQGKITRLTGELEAAQAELTRLAPSAGEPASAGTKPLAPVEPLDLASAPLWESGGVYELGSLVDYQGRFYRALEATGYSPAAYPQAWQEVTP